MKRILIDARESGTTSGRYVDKLIEYLHKSNPPYEIILLAKPQRFEFLRGLAPNFETVVTSFKEFSFDEQIGLRKQIERLKPDLVFFPFVQQPVRYQGKVVTTIQDLTGIRFRNPTKNRLVYGAKQSVYKRVIKKVAKKSVYVITPTEFVKQDVIKYTKVPAEKITVTLEAADAITDKPEPVKQLQNKQFIMYVGRPQPHKNLPRLIKAFARLQKEHPNLWLVLVGKKDVLYQQLEANVQKKSIPNVLFTDFISEGQLRWLYEHTEAYVFPSLSEGFGLPSLEAMMHGAPVVSSNATCLPEVNKDGAVYFNPLKIADVAEKIGSVLDNPVLAKDIADKGKKVAAGYSWQRMAKQTLEVFDKALKS